MEVGQKLPTYCAQGRSSAAQLGLWLDEDSGVQQLARILTDAHPGALRAHHAPLSAARRHLNVYDVRQILHAIADLRWQLSSPWRLIALPHTWHCKRKSKERENATMDTDTPTTEDTVG